MPLAERLCSRSDDVVPLARRLLELVDARGACAEAPSNRKRARCRPEEPPGRQGRERRTEGRIERTTRRTPGTLKWTTRASGSAGRGRDGPRSRRGERRTRRRQYRLQVLPAPWRSRRPGASSSFIGPPCPRLRGSTRGVPTDRYVAPTPAPHPLPSRKLGQSPPPAGWSPPCRGPESDPPPRRRRARARPRSVSSRPPPRPARPAIAALPTTAARSRLAPKDDGRALAGGRATRRSTERRSNGSRVVVIRSQVKLPSHTPPRLTLALATAAVLSAPPRVATAQAHSPVLESATSTPATPITLDAAIARALERNPTFETAREEVRRTEALVREVQATWIPTLTGNGTYAHLDGARIEGGWSFCRRTASTRTCC